MISRKVRQVGVHGVIRAARRRLLPWLEPKRAPIQVALDEILAADDFTIVQIGAYVGASDTDPLFDRVTERLRNRPGGRLICVEPVGDFYDRLVENYAGVPRVEFARVAIAERAGPASFYRLGVDPTEHGYPEWLAQLSSLKKERMGTLWDNYEADPDYKRFYLEHRVEETVECITFDELVRRHAVERIDLLQMDVEGYELEILRTVDFARMPVRFVNYENVLLQHRQREAERLMRSHGFRTVDYVQDTFCYRAADRRLAKGWSTPR